MIKRFFKWLSKKREDKKSINPKHYKFSIKKDKKDDRDHTYNASVNEIILPSKTDLTRYVPPIKNQGSIGSCGSHAAITMYEIMMNIKEGPDVPLSELFHYYEVRQKGFEDTFPADSGQCGRNSMKVMQKVGNVPERLAPYITSKYNTKPTLYTLVKSMGRFWKVKSYNRCTGLLSIKTSLANNQPVWLGIPVNNDIKTYKSGVLKYTGSNLGGHAMCIVGYDDYKEAFRLVNSWGCSYGDKGFLWLSYNYLDRAPWYDAWNCEL